MLLGLMVMPILFTYASPDSPTLRVEPVGQIGGTSYSVAVQGDYAYAGIGPCLVILNSANPARPTLVGQSGVLPGLVQGIAVAGSYAYIAAGVVACVSST